MIKDAKIYGVWGWRGSGKSYLVKKLLKGRGRIIVFDPVGDYRKMPGFKAVHSIEEMHKLVMKKWKTGYKISYPVTRDHPLHLHQLAVWLWEAQASATQKIMLVIEEANLGYPARNMKAAYYGVQQLVLQGRHRGIEIIAVSQRPNLINRDFRSGVFENYIFPMEDEDDIDIVGRKIGRRRLEEYRNMKPYYHFKTGGEQVELLKA